MVNERVSRAVAEEISSPETTPPPPPPPRSILHRGPRPRDSTGQPLSVAPILQIDAAEDKEEGDTSTRRSTFHADSMLAAKLQMEEDEAAEEVIIPTFSLCF